MLAKFLKTSLSYQKEWNFPQTKVNTNNKDKTVKNETNLAWNQKFVKSFPLVSKVFSLL